MKLLFNHVSSFSYHTTEKSKVGKDLGEGQKEGSMDDALLVKICSEESDSQGVVTKTVEEIEDVAEDLGAERLILFPWAHLSKDLAPPEVSRNRVEDIGEELEESGYGVLQVPFGWYKEWELISKGHPMSVLSREV
ncbi:MAG: threonyl-tRNA synthetase editing domain-containing protein [Halodesulfurarchaeum sp.]